MAKKNNYYYYFRCTGIESITGTKKGVYTCPFPLFHKSAIYMKLVFDQVHDELVMLLIVENNQISTDLL